VYFFCNDRGLLLIRHHLSWAGQWLSGYPFARLSVRKHHNNTQLRRSHGLHHLPHSFHRNLISAMAMADITIGKNGNALSNPLRKITSRAFRLLVEGEITGASQHIATNVALIQYMRELNRISKLLQNVMAFWIEQKCPAAAE